MAFGSAAQTTSQSEGCSLHFPGHGIVVDGGATGTTIGGDRSWARPYRSRRLDQRKHLLQYCWCTYLGAGTTGNTVKGNLIGTDITGQAANLNNIGVAVGSGASGNIIGGTTASTKNVLSGNYWAGAMFQVQGTSNNLLIGNYIGTNVSGQVALSNSVDGIVIQGGAAGNQIGGSAAGERNVISGNARHGVPVGSRE